jgi:hypothetical protein
MKDTFAARGFFLKVGRKLALRIVVPATAMDLPLTLSANVGEPPVVIGKPGPFSRHRWFVVAVSYSPEKAWDLAGVRGMNRTGPGRVNLSIG